MSLPATVRLAVEELCARREVETAHAYQVAALALKLFDATHAVCGIPAADRPLLEAAAILHDVGYAADPRRHAEVGAALIRHRRLDGFTPPQCAMIATLIRLHPAALKPEAARSLIPRRADPHRILYAAALLRLADALDSAHLQDAAIASVRVSKRSIRVGVICRHFPPNVEAARRQATLWREAFPVDVDLRLVGAGRSRPALVGPATAFHEGVRRILSIHHQMFLLNVAGALEGHDREALHDLRIAIRRLRTVLRAFRQQLAGTAARRLERDLQQLNRVLGAARDLDVWIGFFADEANARQFTGHRLWAGFVAHQVELRRLQQVTVRRHLQGAGFLALRLRLGRLLRVDLARAPQGEADQSLLGPARQALRRALREAMERGHWRLSPAPEKLHRFRILLRRVRYLAALLGPVLGGAVRKLGKRAHALERVLGGMRDADLALARIRQEGPTPPRPLVRHLEALRRADSAALEQAWDRLQERPFLLEIHRVLKG